MKALPVLALLVIAGTACAQAPAGKPGEPAQDQKPFLYDGVMPKGLKSFSPPTPVTVYVPGDPQPKMGPAPPKIELIMPPARPEIPAPEQKKKGLG